MPFSSYGKIAVRQFLIDTLRAFCESQIRASCQGLIVHHHPIIQVALDAVGVFQMSESNARKLSNKVSFCWIEFCRALPAKAPSITNVLASNFTAYPFVSAWMNLSGFVSNATL